jgi:VanZ family protein
MPSNRHSFKYWLSAWLPVVLGIAIIAMESTEFMGAEYTNGPLRRFFEVIFGHFTDNVWVVVHHLVRKTGHFVGYGVIGLAWLRAWWMTLPRSRFFQDAFLALLGTALMASADEFHQSLLPDRTGTPWDALLDCCGALTLQLVVYIFMRMLKPKRLSRDD